MARSALITGGTGGLGAAVTRAFLDGGWRVVVPLYDEAERDRVPAHERLVLEQADLFDPDSAAAVTALAAGDDDGAARRRREPRRAASRWAAASTRRRSRTSRRSCG